MILGIKEDLVKRVCCVPFLRATICLQETKKKFHVVVCTCVSDGEVPLWSGSPCDTWHRQSMEAFFPISFA